MRRMDLPRKGPLPKAAEKKLPCACLKPGRARFLKLRVRLPHRHLNCSATAKRASVDVPAARKDKLIALVQCRETVTLYRARTFVQSYFHEARVSVVPIRRIPE